MIVSELMRQLPHGLEVRHVQALNGGADGARGRGVLAPGGDPRVEKGPQGKVEDNVVLVGTDDAKEIQFEFRKVEIFDRESKLHMDGMEERVN